jgi:hypothetical protein
VVTAVFLTVAGVVLGLARPFHGFRGSGELKDAKVAFPSGKLEVLKQQEPLTERHLLDEEA